VGRDVGRPRATFQATGAAQTMTVDCGGAKSATDKIFQAQRSGYHMAASGTSAAQDFGKLYRFVRQLQLSIRRHVILSNVTATAAAPLPRQYQLQ